MLGEVGALGEMESRGITCSCTGVFMSYYAVRNVQEVNYGSTIQCVLSERICTAVRNKV
jgi:hypothetical protein